MPRSIGRRSTRTPFWFAALHLGLAGPVRRPGHCRPLCCKGEQASAFASRQVRLPWASFRYLVAKQLPRFSAEPLAAFHSLLAFGLTSRSRCFHAGSNLVKAHIKSKNDDRTVCKGLRADRGKNEIIDLGNKHLHGFASLNWTPE